MVTWMIFKPKTKTSTTWQNGQLIDATKNKEDAIKIAQKFADKEKTPMMLVSPQRSGFETINPKRKK